MERIRAEMGNPRFTGKGSVIEGVLTLKLLIDCADVEELRLIEDLSALADKTVIATIEPLQQEMKFTPPPKGRQEADPRQEELIPKVWELRKIADAADAETFWRFIAKEAAEGIAAAALLAPFVPDAEGCSATALRFTTSEKDLIVGYLATRVPANLPDADVRQFTITSVSADPEGGAEEVPEPWLMVGKQVLIPMEHAPEWSNAADHGGYVVATALEIINGEDGQPATVEVEFRGFVAEGDNGEVEMVSVVTVEAEVVLPIPEPAEIAPEEAAEPWPIEGSKILIPSEAAWDADSGVKVEGDYADGEVVAVDDGTAMVRVMMLSGATVELAFPVEVLVRPLATDDGACRDVSLGAPEAEAA